MAGKGQSLKRKLEATNNAVGKKPKVEVNYVKDGTTIYLTPITYLRSQPTHMLSLRRLLYSDLLLSPSEPRTLQAAFMTTFCHEDSFIAPIVQSGVKFCLVTHSNRGGKVQQISPNYTVILPKLRDSWGKFHPKLYILQFPECLRVVVTSANLVQHDWSEIGQTIWFQDFPKGTGSNDFSRSLKDFTNAMIPGNGRFSLRTDLGIDLDAYDFSEAKVTLLYSIPGRFPSIDSYGLGRMQRLVRDTGVKYSLATFQFSSISGLTSSFLTQVKSSFTGKQDGELALIYPTLDRVQRCHRGLDAGLTTFLSEEMYTSKAFPRESMKKLEDPEGFPEITGHLSHSKVLVVTKGEEVDDDTVIYLGSHNLSSSAWGRFEKSGSQIFMANYELGVVFLPSPNSASMKRSIITRLPFKFPAASYEKRDIPWMLDVHHPEEANS